MAFIDLTALVHNRGFLRREEQGQMMGLMELTHG